jgi:arylsulfatase A-like enzyme
MKNTSIAMLMMTLASTGAVFAEQAKPNIVIIFTDDQGWADVGYQGNEYYETPNIDRLAAQSMVFSNGYSANAVCSPSRAGLITGRDPIRHGITNWIEHWIPIEKGKHREGYEDMIGGDRSEARGPMRLLTPKNFLYLEHEEVTIAEVLKDAGYETAHIGKWHLGQKDWFPDTQGFDHNINGVRGGVKTFFDPYQTEDMTDRMEGEYLTDREADESRMFIEKAAAKNQPFFLYVNHHAPHYPLEAKQELIDYYEKKPMPAGRNYNAVHAAMVHSIDDAVGTVMETLKELGIEDETIVFFTSDNGGQKTPWPNNSSGPADNSPLRDGKGYPYEGGIRVPYIVKWPGTTQAGTVSEQIVSGIDILPTICEMVGQPIPSERPVDGVSLVPVLKGKKSLGRDTLYFHLPHYWGPGNVVHPYSAMRKGDWKLIHYYEDDKVELYNLKDDVSEQNDLAGEKPKKAKALDEHLIQWMTDNGAKFPIPNPAYQSNTD